MIKVRACESAETHAVLPEETMKLPTVDLSGLCVKRARVKLFEDSLGFENPGDPCAVVNDIVRVVVELRVVNEREYRDLGVMSDKCVPIDDWQKMPRDLRGQVIRDAVISAVVRAVDETLFIDGEKACHP